MRIAQRFIQEAYDEEILSRCDRVEVALFGSLGATGRGHSSDKAVLWGLMGDLPESLDISQANRRVQEIQKEKKIHLLGIQAIPFDIERDLLFHADTFLKYHPNGMTLSLYDRDRRCLKQKTYYSTGGGAVVSEEELNRQRSTEGIRLPYGFESASELLNQCRKHSLSISALMMENEKSLKEEERINRDLLQIWKVMKECVEEGSFATGELPVLGVKKRAHTIYKKLKNSNHSSMSDPLEVMDWLNLWALAVNEQNACGAKVVTAPTNGAAGIIPAVIHYMNRFLACPSREQEEERIIRFLLTAGAIGILYQKNASISGADVGCQGEVGVACSMAAAALTEAMGGTIEQIENAAEIAMEHSLGLTCDPVAGLVQVPCIERNAVAAVRAVNSARMALNGDGSHFVSLDNVIKTMLETGRDMKQKYKETSKGGLAVNIVTC
jgi:L-serine dehydratase